MSTNDEDHHVNNSGRAANGSNDDGRRLLSHLSPSPSPEGIIDPIPSQTRHANRNRHAYAQVSTQADDDYERQQNNSRPIPIPTDDDIEVRSELDPLHPEPPQAYYQRGFPQRITKWGRLVLTLTVIALACLSLAAVMDVSTPSYDGLEPGTDTRSVADSVLAAIDRSADPCENFYEYACGSWIRTSKLPPDRSSFSKSFSSVSDRVRLIVKDLLEGTMQKSDDASITKAGLFYASCINQHSIGPVNTLFLSPLRDYFTDAKDTKSYVKLLAKLNTISSATLFDMYVGADDKNPTEYATFLSQASLGMPYRDNYISNSDHDVEMRKRYLIYVESMLVPAGKARLVPRQDHAKIAKDILEFETKIANFSLPPDQLQDPNVVYNKIMIKDMPSDLYLNDMFTDMGIDSKDMKDSVIIDNPAYFDSINAIMKSLDTDVEMRAVVKAYLGYHAAVAGAKEGVLGAAAYNELFKFRQFVYGIKQMPERWKICQSLTNSMLGDAVGKAFVEEHFSEVQMNVAKTLSKEITKAFSVELKKLDWMDDETKEAAQSKLSAINWKVGYSEKLDEYDDVTVLKDSLSNNVLSCIEHGYKKSINRLGTPVDKTEWFMLPQEINAYYSPVRNEMVFPAGILRQPFFSDAYPEAMNYGSIGAVVGHEMSHGFDANGRNYDKDGELKSWWSAESGKQYDERSQCYVNLYNTFKPRDIDIHVNGNLTLNENIADTNGVNVAYQAFKSLPNNSKDGIDPPNILLAKELTNDQLFFVAYAQTWCSLNRPEALKVQMMTDPHSPGQFRVLGPLSQSDIFAKAFQCRNGTRYNPMTKCHLW